MGTFGAVVTHAARRKQAAPMAVRPANPDIPLLTPATVSAPRHAEV
jgi:hypothetical protein